MSVPSAYRDTGQESSQDGVHMRELRVEFLQDRPKDPLELVVHLNDKKYETEIDRDDEARWSGNVYCPLPSTVLVQIRRNNPFILPGNSLIPLYHASVRAPLSLGLSSISDDAGRISVTFITSEATVASRAKAAEEQECARRQGSVTRQLEEIWSAVKFVRSTVSRTPNDMHSAADLAIRLVAFRSLIEACENPESCSDEVLNLVEEFEPFLLVKGHAEKLEQREETRCTVQVMLELIERTSQYILDRMSSRAIGDPSGEEYDMRLSNLKMDFTRAKEAFSRSVELVVFDALAGVERSVQLSILHGKLSECEYAHFRSGEDNLCLEGTRADLLGRIMDWVVEDISARPNVFWLGGKAGSGKSTVANTVAQAVQDRGYLLSCFFCKRDDANLSDPRRVLPTLAYRFAQHHESYRASIFSLVHTDPHGVGIATTADIDIQFETLFEEVLSQVIDPLRPHVIVIDALDECGSSKAWTSLAKCIVELSRLAPWIRVFVTSRDEPAIRKIFTADLCVQCNIDEEKDTDNDIRRYIVSHATNLDIGLSSADVEPLVRRAAGLFIWYTTLFKHLSKCFDPKENLASFLRGEEDVSWSPLYQLYDRVLDSAAETEEDLSFMGAVLALVTVATDNRPLSARAIALFLRDNERYRECREEHVQRVVAKLHAVLYVDCVTHAAIRAYHASFYDFVEHKTASAVSGWEGLEMTHSRMFRCCIKILNAQLRFNICAIEKPVLNEDIPDLPERISKNISEELQYSSRYWFTHLSPSNLTQSDIAPDVQELLCSRKLLIWLETLSLQGSLVQCSLAFRACMSFFQGYSDIVVAANDAHRFVAGFSEAMNSVPHIYLSSLFWLPEDSQTYRNLGLPESIHPGLIEGKRNHRWDSIIWERSINRRSQCVACSPDSQYVACGTDDGRIYIWNAHTGAREGEPLQGHSGAVSCLAYSPNGQLIASGSGDYTVRIWDARTGVPVFEALVGHTGPVHGVAWSPDGLSIASCSGDETIRIWNTRTGTQQSEPLRGHKGYIRAVTYAPDGAHIASGGYDETVHIWRTDTYQEVGPPFRGHSSFITSVRYSPDSRTIVSGSWDHTIRIWDAQTGEAVGQPLQGHTDPVESVMYSPNSQFIVSGSCDRTVRVWDAESGAPIGESLRGHSRTVTSISCSPDGLSIVSISEDGMIRVWGVPVGSRAHERPQGHDSPVKAVAFSPDGHHLATGSSDCSVRLWDAGTGALINEPLQGHEGGVNSVAYSPRGESIASGSDDKSVRIWNTKTGEAIGEPLRGHFKEIHSVAYSPNGHLIASASEDRTVRLWDAQTGSPIGQPLRVESQALSVAFSPDSQSLACGTSNKTILVWDISSTVSLRMTLCGHSQLVRSTTFSPNGRYVASGSDDETVRIWDVQTGEPKGNPLKHHRWKVRCVAFSPDSSLVASGSIDGTVRLCDVQTRLAVGDPLRGHSASVLSVALSPDGRSLASAGEDSAIYVYTVPSTSPSQALGEAEARARWLECCSRVNKQTGWITDGDSLLLWTPAPYRPVLARRARILISKSAPGVACDIDYETLFRYSGAAWVNVFSDGTCN